MAVAAPGLLLVWSKGAAARQAIRLPPREAFTIGRELVPDDDRTSANHAAIYARGLDFTVSNSGSRNGTYLDGREIDAPTTAWDGSVLRTGSSLWITVLDITPYEAATRPHSRVGLEAIGSIIESAVRARAPELPIHYSIVEACLDAVWRDRDTLVAAIESALDRCTADRADRLKASHLGATEPRHPVQSFASYFALEMGAPAPFTVPPSYHAHTLVRLKGIPYETVITTHPDEPPPTGARLEDHARPPGYFMAGFSGHGINSYSVCLAQTTERSSIYLRLPYGAQRKDTLALLERYTWLAESLPVAHVTLVDAMGVARYELVRHDGTVVSSPSSLVTLRDVDLLALAMPE
ncbi:hypothetical protein BH11MYX1_BH11MYX1_47920 [soil metagenome]